MKTTLVTYATPQFYLPQRSLIKSARKFGVDTCLALRSNDFKRTAFYKRYLSINSQIRGAGYWLWKPFFILETLKSLKKDEILIYSDAGVNIISLLQPLIDLVCASQTGVVLFENYQASGYFSKSKGFEFSEYNLYIEVNKNKYWTKRDAFVLMSLDKEEYWNSPQVDANFQVYRKNNFAINFLEEWLCYCCNEQILTDLPNKCALPDFDNLFEHIHDQAVLSLLAEKNKIELFRCSSQFGNHYKMKEYRVTNEFLLLPYSKEPKVNSPYGTIIDHHRKKYRPFLFRLQSFIRQEGAILLSYLR